MTDELLGLLSATSKRDNAERLDEEAGPMGESKGKAQRFEVINVSANELEAMGSTCAWRGCTEHFRGDMPEGWRWMLKYHHPRPVLDVLKFLQRGGKPDRDAALCPKPF